MKSFVTIIIMLLSLTLSSNAAIYGQYTTHEKMPLKLSAKKTLKGDTILTITTWGISCPLELGANDRLIYQREATYYDVFLNNKQNMRRENLPCSNVRKESTKYNITELLEEYISELEKQKPHLQRHEFSNNELAAADRALKDKSIKISICFGQHLPHQYETSTTCVYIDRTKLGFSDKTLYDFRELQ